jgi:hypothetical protein
LNLSSSALEGEEEEERDDREERVKGGSSQLTPHPLPLTSLVLPHVSIPSHVPRHVPAFCVSPSFP